jgi:hypothetical protein
VEASQLRIPVARKAATIQPSVLRSFSSMPWSIASLARYGGARAVAVAARREMIESTTRRR